MNMYIMAIILNYSRDYITCIFIVIRQNDFVFPDSKQKCKNPKSSILHRLLPDKRQIKGELLKHGYRDSIEHTSLPIHFISVYTGR